MIPPYASPILAAGLVLAGPISAAWGQQLAERVNRAPDGNVRMSFATRAEVCGDGTFVGEDSPRGFRMYFFHDRGYGMQTLQDIQPDCRSGPMLLGHAHPAVVEALRERAALGTNFAYVSRPALELAEEMTRAVPCAERVRFCASGTEATAYAVRLARAFTGRTLVLKF